MKLTLATILAARASGRKAPPMSSYVYLHTERENRDQGIGNLYTVGFYGPAGEWHPESDHSTADLAAVRVAFLNGGSVTPSPYAPRHPDASWTPCQSCRGNPDRMPSCLQCHGAGGAFDPPGYPAEDATPAPRTTPGPGGLPAQLQQPLPQRGQGSL